MLLALSVISPQGAVLGPTAFKVFDERGGSIGRLDSNDWTLPDREKFVSTRQRGHSSRQRRLAISKTPAPTARTSIVRIRPTTGGRFRG